MSIFSIFLNEINIISVIQAQHFSSILNLTFPIQKCNIEDSAFVFFSSIYFPRQHASAGQL